MNEVLKQLSDRKSVRAYEDREISKEDKQLILEAAAQAPTAGNMQMYTILDITDEEEKKTLSVLCDNQPFIATGKMLLLFLADYQKWIDAFNAADANPRTPGVGDLMIALSDAFIAAQNTVVAAHSLGIGSCYIGDIFENYEKLQELLKLPPYVFPAALLVFGYPTKQQSEREKPERVDLKYVVHENTYRHLGEAELREMFEPRCKASDFNTYMKGFCKFKNSSDFAAEMTRSVAVALKNFEK